MDGLRELSEKTLAAIFQNYYVTLALLGVVLAFALYVYFFRGTIAEYFDAHTEKKPAVASPTKQDASADQ
jgi:hypothetical protein